MYKTLTVKGREYKLRLSAQSFVELEKKLGASVLDALSFEDGKNPRISDFIYIFHSSLVKYQHNISLSDAYDIFDDFMDEGGTFDELLSIILDTLSVLGFSKKEDKAAENSEAAEVDKTGE